MSEHIGMSRVVKEMLSEKTIFNFNRQKCREELFSFLDKNDWFLADWYRDSDVNITVARKEEYYLRRSDVVKLQNHIRLWINAYGKSDKEKLEILLKRFNYPDTAKSLRDFFEGNKNTSDYAALCLVDFLCDKLQGEIATTMDTALETLVGQMDVLPLNSAKLFSKYLTHLKIHGHIKNGYAYDFAYRSEKNKTAYSAKNFLKMAYIVFNESSWKNEQLLEKALSSAKFANLWLFVAFHFICAFRNSDLCRLPKPRLNLPGEAVRELIAKGEFDGNQIATELEFRLHYTPMKPNKTSSQSNVPDLKLFVPESLKKPFGVILGIAASWKDDVKSGEAFIKRAGNKTEIRAMFGSDFSLACENAEFSTRRANKAYLQGIEAMCPGEVGKPKGYMIAAVARSHKSGFATLPKSTEIYLRDSAFSGYTPEFIAKQMFERGVFSFIPALMLEMYAKKEYKVLPVAEQTQSIIEIGISASGIEGVAKIVENALDKARAAIAHVMSRPKEIREATAQILQNIASGNAPSKQDDVLCLMSASGFACVCPERSCCIGCGYEIYTKTMLHCMVAEYKRLILAKSTAEKSEAERIKAILKEAVMPVITQILTCVKQFGEAGELYDFSEILKGGLELC